jgi:hypothetical protein
LFSNTLSLYSPLNVRDQVLHPDRTTGKIIVVHAYLHEHFFFFLVYVTTHS